MSRTHLTGFTLAELGIGLATIGVLGAALTPACQEALRNQATCASNEEHIGRALFEYAQDNDHQLPMVLWYDQDTFQAHDWISSIYPYLPQTASVLQCPSFPSVQYGEYGINWELARNGAGTWQWANTPGYRIITVRPSEVEDPGQKVMLVEKGQVPNWYQASYLDPTESNWTNPLNIVHRHPTQPDTHNELSYDFDCALTSTAPECATYGTSPSTMPRSRHDNRCNTLFVDGHVRAVPRGGFDWLRNIYMPRIYESLEGVGPQ